MAADGLIVCTRGSVTCGLDVRDGVIRNAPPYLRRWAMVDAGYVWRSLKRSGWSLEWMPDADV